MGMLKTNMADLSDKVERIRSTWDPGLIGLAAARLNDLLIDFEGGLTAEQIDEAAFHAAMADAFRLDNGHIRLMGR